MNSFTYVQVGNLTEALDLLDIHRERACVMAGGTDVMVAVNVGKLDADYLLGLSEIEGMDFIREEKDVLKIGPLVTMADAKRSGILEEKYRCLWQAASRAAGPQVRNLGTIGGNLGTASPAGDFIPPLMALGATVKVARKNSDQSVPIHQFFKGPKQSLLTPGSLITEIDIPSLPAHTGTSFYKIGKRKAMSISLASAAAVVKVSDDGSRFENLAIALGSLAPTVVRAKEVEEALKGEKVGLRVVEQACELARKCINPITDGRATAWYRVEISPVLVKRAISSALSELGIQLA